MIQYKDIIATSICLILLFSNLSIIAHAGQSLNNSISVQLESDIVDIGSLFNVTIYLDLYENVSGWSIDELTFQPDLLSVENVEEGDLFNGVQSSFAILGEIDNITGKITDIICYTPTGDNVSESGSLCIITFYAKKAGLAEINLSVTLSYAGNEVPHEDHNATIEIQDGGIDAIPPEIKEVSAHPRLQYNNGYVNITCDVTDNVAVENTNVIITGPSGFTTVNHSMIKIKETNTYYYNTSYSIIGTYPFQIWAKDTSNNQNVSTTYIFEITDNQNESPVANDDYYTIDEDTTCTIVAPGILINDTDAENDPLIAIKITNPEHGILTEFNQDGSFAYIPDANFCGNDSFTYKANDGISDSNIATVHITVGCINDPPVADFTYSPDSPTVTDTIIFTDNSNDIDGSIINWTWAFGDGNISYQKNPEHQYTTKGQYIVHLTVKDDNGAETTKNKTITIKPHQNLSITLTRPLPHTIYIMDKPKTLRIGKTFILGKITINAEVQNAEGETTVELYIDDTFISRLTQKPYTWILKERLFGKHTIKVVAHDSSGASDTASLDARIFCFTILKNRLLDRSDT